MKQIITKATGELAFAKDFIKYTKLEINDIKHSFFKIGFRLNEAEEFSYYKQLGYEDIYELAKAEFGFEKTTTKNLMAINRAYSDNYFNSPTQRKSYTMQIAEFYDKYSQTQLVEMLPLTAYERNNIPADMTVSEIRDYKKALKEEGGWRSKKIADPKKTVEEYRQWQQLLVSKPVIKKDDSDIPQGQLVFADDGNVTEFHQTGAEQKLQKILEEAEEIEPVEVFNPDKELYTNEEIQERNRAFIEAERAKELASQNRIDKKFKDKQEIIDFILDKDNYTNRVLYNEELGLTIDRLDFENGLQLYRTETRLVKRHLDQEWVKYCLVYKENDLPSDLYQIAKIYNTDNYSLDYIVMAIEKLNLIF